VKGVMMKKALLILMVSILSIGMAVTFSLTGCKGAVEEAVEEVEEAVEEVEEAVEEVEEAVEEDMDEIDPFILEVRAPWEELKVLTDVSWRGPGGETPQTDDTVWLTKGEVEQLRAGKPDGSPYTYALCGNNTAGEYSLSMNAGPDSGLWEFMEYCGIEQVAFTSAEFDPIQQKADVETVVALEPDVICAYATDPVTGAENFRPAVDAGIPIAFISTLPDGYEYGKETIGITTNNPWENGIYCALAMHDLLGDEAKVGYVFYDDVYFVCNYIDQGFKTYADENYTDWTVYEQGFVAETQAGEAAAAILARNPDVQGFFTTYMVPGMHIVAAITEADRLDDVIVVTFGIDEPTMINMIQDGPVKAISTDSPYLVGMNHAIQACYALLDKPLEQPSFVVCPSTVITKENIRDIWDIAMHLPMSDTLTEALDEAGL
jgi:ribose transport system substrate-binding protein